MPLGLGNLGEHDAERLARGRSQLNSAAILAHDLPPRRGLPPSRAR